LSGLRWTGLCAAVGTLTFVAGLSPRLVRSLNVRRAAAAVATSGHTVGAVTTPAPIVVEFGDYECSPCAAADTAMARLLSKWRFVLRFHYLPSERDHPYAFEAAVAAECAATQNRFEPMHHLLFRRRADFGAVSWAMLAAAAGVFDTTAFTACMDGDAAARVVVGDIAMGRLLRLRQTPAFLLGSAVYYGVPQDSTIERYVRDHQP